MALKLPILFPIFSPLPPANKQCLNPPNQRGPGEVRFSRWNNANAEKFNQKQRAQQEIEGDIRRHRRFESAARITQIEDSTNDNTSEPQTFKSIGTPSSPSAPSIPGRKSKYSKPDVFNRNSRLSKTKHKLEVPNRPPIESKPDVKITDNGVSYVIDGAPFEFQYSYTETPKVKPLKLREPAFAPFGPTTMPRPWTGRPPLPPSKKKLKEFDSFKLPPPNKKGVKPIQKPGPYLPGTGPRYVRTREEILGEPLTEEEVRDLVNGCIRTQRQLNIGRDGLTHNMLENIHALWKRRRVCKIKCKGVCTVDMDNVCQHLEEKTGGKIIYRRGGVIFLFRGRNYNSRTRPRFPLMLWKPITPVYPRLIKSVPEGLTSEEAAEMRKKGRHLIPICKIGKNGVYCDLVENVREAFEVCELVRINCQGVKSSDYRKIGAKLKDLVPCVLISFEYEHILMWRGVDWKFSLQKVDNEATDKRESDLNDATSVVLPLADHIVSVSQSQNPSVDDHTLNTLDTGMLLVDSKDMHIESSEDDSSIQLSKPSIVSEVASTLMATDSTTSENTNIDGHVLPDVENVIGSEIVLENVKLADDDYESIPNSCVEEARLNDGSQADAEATTNTAVSDTMSCAVVDENKMEPFGVSSIDHKEQQDLSKSFQDHIQPAGSVTLSMERVLVLRTQAIETGSAVILDDDTSWDADSIFKKALAFAQSAPPGPVFRRPRKVAAQNVEKKESNSLQAIDNAVVSRKSGKETQISKTKGRKELDENYLGIVPQGSLRVDELAKLLA